MFSNRILLNLQQIEAINWKNLNRPETALVNLPDLEAVPASSELEKLLSADFLSQELCYDAQGNLYSNSFYDVLKTKIKAIDAIIVNPIYNNAFLSFLNNECIKK